MKNLRRLALPFYRFLLLLCACTSGCWPGRMRRSNWIRKCFQELRWRSIGPFRAGRVLAVTGVRGQPEVYYFGSRGRRGVEDE